LNECPVTKPSCCCYCCCCCYKHTGILIHGSYYANSKKRKEKGRRKRTNERTKERRKRKHDKLFNMRAARAHAHMQKALPCKRERMGHCHHTTTTHIRSRGDEGEYMEAHTFRGQNKECLTMLGEKNVLFLFFLDVVVAASYPSAN
jgi:hypothetical protein